MIYSLIQYAILSIVCIYLVNYYASKEVSIHVKIWSVVTWVLNFGLALLVPQDVFLTLQAQNDEKDIKQLAYQYLLLYWLVYLLTWTVIPVLQQWQDAGDLDSYDRLKRSLKTNGIFYLILLGISIFFLILILVLGVSQQLGLIIFLKCIATIWGMLLLMILLGYSLIQIPRTMWRNAHPSQYLIYLYQKIYQTQQDVQQSKRQFKRITAYISYVRKNTQEQEIIKYCNASQDIIPIHLRSIINNSFQRIITSDYTGYLEDFPISVESSIQHHRRMKRAITRVQRQERGLKEYIFKAIFYQDIIRARGHQEPLQSLAKKTNRLTSYWYCYLRPTWDKIAACFIALCSFILLISQTQVFLSQQNSLLGYLLLFDNFQVIRILAFFVMGFIIYMSNYALFRLKLANLYGLYRKQSDGPSLMFATVNFSRIGIAIVFNFFDMVRMENSIFSTVMQAPEMGLLGQWVLKGLPGILWIMALCHYYNFWGWIANKLGMGSSYSFSSHQLKSEAQKLSSPLAVVTKRQQLQQRCSESIFRQMSNV